MFHPKFAVSHRPSNVDVLEHLVSREGKLHEVYTTLKCTILSHQDSTGKYFDIIKSYKGDMQKSETCFAGGGGLTLNLPFSPNSLEWFLVVAN